MDCGSPGPSILTTVVCTRTLTVIYWESSTVLGKEYVQNLKLWIHSLKNYIEMVTSHTHVPWFMRCPQIQQSPQILTNYLWTNASVVRWRTVKETDYLSSKWTSSVRDALQSWSLFGWQERRMRLLFSKYICIHVIYFSLNWFWSPVLYTQNWNINNERNNEIHKLWQLLAQFSTWAFSMW